MSTVFVEWRLSSDAAQHGAATVALPAVIGRSARSDIVLPGHDNGVSRSHVQLEAHVAGIRVRDLGSTNGTLFDGQPIREALVPSGATLAIGRYVVSLSLRVLCPNPDCGKLIDANQQLCPHCGRFAADAETVYPGHGPDSGE